MKPLVLPWPQKTSDYTSFEEEVIAMENIRLLDGIYKYRVYYSKGGIYPFFNQLFVFKQAKIRIFQEFRVF
ncbi:hypothetical protein ICC18_28965 [Paenibacillus sp. WST5]|uniref:Uncharacterized protein n=1 Tax=Paenibacillus sedimenti TaxID=2770274 RepID=A0A926QN69_9BACL|nr:hypothetical protein [Paenibacillus sedimenti]